MTLGNARTRRHEFYHHAPYASFPGVAFRTRPEDTDEKVRSLLGTVLRQHRGQKHTQYANLIEQGKFDDARGYALDELSLRFPGYKFGVIGEDCDQCRIYGWMPEEWA